MASSSTIPELEDEDELIQIGVNFFDLLPQVCTTIIISFTTPADACRLALVSKDMLSASESDIVWNQFLPSDIDLFLSRSDEGKALLTISQSKKQLYKRLTVDRLLFYNRSMNFWLDRSTGKKCWMRGAWALYIEGSERTYKWKWAPVAGSRFPRAAELLTVPFFYISTTIQTSMLSPSTLYKAYLVYSMTEDAFGFTRPFKASVRIAGAESTYTEPVYLDVRPPKHRVEGRRPIRRVDDWWEMLIGNFYSNDHGGKGDGFAVTVAEEFGNMKGIIVDGIEFRPA